MFVLFEDAGKYLGGRVLSEGDASAQVELDSGKRVKVKAAHIVLRFAQPAPAELIAQARALAAEVELDLAWEFAPEDEFGFAQLATDYFGAGPTLAQQAAALFALFEAPHYFRRAGKGRFRKAPAEIVQQALAAIEKKKVQQVQIDAWAGELAAGQCPAPVREQLYRILFKPDKNAPEYKAVVEAARATQAAPLALLARAGAIDSPYQFHWQRFLFENFPKGTGFPGAAGAGHRRRTAAGRRRRGLFDRRLADHRDRRRAVGAAGWARTASRSAIHIAAPALALTPGGALDQLARERLSTVYMPGHKITMLPDEVVAAYTLTAGPDCPAVSLYARFDAQTLALQGTETQAGTGAGGGQPAARRARRGGHRKLARRPRRCEPNRAATRIRSARAAIIFVSTGEAPEGRARDRARPARGLQPARLQLQAARQRGRTYRRRAGSDQHPPPRRAARPDRLRSHDPGQQQLGRLAGGTGRAGPVPQPGQPGAGRQGAHVDTRPAPCRTGRQELRVEHLAAAPLHRPGEPVADHRGGAPWPYRRAGGALQAEGHRAVRHPVGLRRRLCRLQRLPGRHGALLDAALPAAAGHRPTRGHRHQGPGRRRAGARRHAAAGVSGAGRAGAGARRAGARGARRDRRDRARPARHGDRAARRRGKASDRCRGSRRIRGSRRPAGDRRGHERNRRARTGTRRAPLRIFRHEPQGLQHAATRAWRVGAGARGAADGAVRRSGRRRARVPGNAARSDPGQRRHQRASRQGKGHRAALAGRRRPEGQGPRHQPAAAFGLQRRRRGEPRKCSGNRSRRCRRSRCCC